MLDHAELGVSVVAGPQVGVEGRSAAHLGPLVGVLVAQLATEGEAVGDAAGRLVVDLQAGAVGDAVLLAAVDETVHFALQQGRLDVQGRLIALLVGRVSAGD